MLDLTPEQRLMALSVTRYRRDNLPAQAVLWILLGGAVVFAWWVAVR